MPRHPADGITQAVGSSTYTVKVFRRIRQAFIAPAGYKVLAADYSQIELRIMAHLSSDEGLLTAFKEGHDVHSATASEVFEVARSGSGKDMQFDVRCCGAGDSAAGGGRRGRQLG
jgi:DNA polymerase-1